MIPSSPIRGLILAGGRSSRMGSDKARLVHPDGRTLAVRCRDLLLASGCDGVSVSLRHDQAIPPGLEATEIVRDPEGATAGPMSGILSAMRSRPDADWLVVACDLPRLDVGSLQHLISSRRPGEHFLAYRSESDGLPEPLCTLYARESLPILEQASVDGSPSPRRILIHHGCRLLDPVTSRALENTNTPMEWEDATRTS